MTPKEMMRAAEQAMRSGDLATAATLYRAILVKLPQHVAARKAMQKIANKIPKVEIGAGDVQAMIAMLNQGQFKQVETLANEMIGHAPKVSGLYNIRGLAQTNLQKSDAALASFRKAIQLDAQNYEAFNNLGLRLKESGEPESAKKALEKALQINPQYPQASYNLGTVLVQLADYDAAEAMFEQAIAAVSGFAQAWFELGKLHALRGYREAAISSLEQAIKLDPAYAAAYSTLASVKRFDASDPMIGAMVKLVDGGKILDLELASLAFALGKAFEDAGAIDRSFKYYELGNQTQARFGTYSEDDQIAEFKELKSAFTKASPMLAAKPAKPQPIFVVGMNRSGTTLVEQILASHSQVEAGGEIESISQFAESHRTQMASLRDKDLNRFRSIYQSGLRKLAHAPFVTDKMPANFKYIGLIRKLFPDAPVICLEREARDLCFSNYKAAVESTGHMYSYDQRELARYYLMHRDLMDHWHAVFGDGLYRLSYEKLTKAPETEIRAILAYAGLDWEDAVMSFHQSNRAVKTLSQSQVRNAINRGSVGAWRKFESHLSPMLEELAKGGVV
ncbi:MAG: sulfotransferase [Rhodobacterales bacterium]